MRSDFITMSPAELSRLKAMHELETKAVRQHQVARKLGISVRQVKRLWRAYRAQGELGLVNGHRGKPGNRQRDPTLLSEAIALIGQHYADFGPTLACEKLLERHEITIDRETLRKAMIAAHLWQPKVRRRAYHPPRPRRARFGELIQIDGSPHAWFEDRGSRCTLLVFIDDATSAIVASRFVQAETTNAYFVLAKQYFHRYGLPQAFYSDQFSVFRINTQNGQRTELTQFGRAMDELNIELICANSPQAKGRVERVNQTLQDRLTKELRLEGISTMDAGNAFLASYLPAHNTRFARKPLDTIDAHRELDDPPHLERILASRYERKLTKDLIVQHKNCLYQITTGLKRLIFPKALVQIIEMPEGGIRIERNGTPLDFQLATRREKLAPIRTHKELHDGSPALDPDPKKAHVPAPTHPWRNGYNPLRLAQLGYKRGHL